MIQKYSVVQMLCKWANKKDVDNYLLVIYVFALVIRLGLEPRTPTLKVLCSTC